MPALLLALLLQTAEPALSPGYDACLSTGDAAEGVQPAMQDCANQENAVQDARLNQAYRMRMASLTPKRRAQLRTLQRRWIVERDRRCAWNGVGQLDRLIATECLAREAQTRTLFLERWR